MLIQEGGGFRPQMTPLLLAAGSITDAKQDRFVLTTGFGQSLIRQGYQATGLLAC